MKITIRLSDGKFQSQTFHQNSVVIGRSKKCEMVVLDEALSRQHCRVDLENGAFYLTDLGSSNGVFVNGERLPLNTKTPISTFWQLGLGILELQLQDTEDVPNFTRSTQININNQTSPPPKKIVTTSEKKSLRINPFLTVSIVALVAIVYLFANQKKESAQKSELLLENVPITLRDVEDTFLSSEDYHKKEELLYCSNEFTLCDELKLSEKDGEGYRNEENKNFFFAINIAKHAKRPEFSKISEEDQDLIIPSYLILNSKFFDLFENKKIGQIHILVKNSKSLSHKVLRLHQKYFSLQGPERKRLLTDLYSALQNGQCEEFKAASKATIKIQNL